MAMTNDEKMMLRYMAYIGKKEQEEAVSSAILKLQMMGLTPANGMVECPSPSNIHPLRWRGMILHAWNNKE